MELLITFLIASFIFFLFLLLNIKTNHQLELQQWVVAPKIESRVLDRLQANVENKLSIKQEQDFFDTPQQLIERLAEKSLEKRLVLLTKTVTTDKEPSEAELLEFFKLKKFSKKNLKFFEDFSVDLEHRKFLKSVNFRNFRHEK